MNDFDVKINNKFTEELLTIISNPAYMIVQQMNNFVLKSELINKSSKSLEYCSFNFKSLQISGADFIMIECY